MDVWPAGFSYPDSSALPLVFVPVPEPKAGKNRVHLDLATESMRHQAAEVERLLALGAAPIDIGQGGDVPWTVLADPEGNEFCVLDPRPVYRDTGPVAAVVADCADPAAVAGFWSLATGWKPASSTVPECRCGLRTGSGRTWSCCRRWTARRSRTGSTWTWPRTRTTITRPRSGADRARARCRSTSARETCRGACWPIRRAASSACCRHADVMVRPP